MKRVADNSTTSIEIEVESGQDTIVHLKGRVDVDSSPAVRNRLRAILLKDALPYSVSVNLAGVTVRRERRWTSAGATPARELVRSTR